VTSPPLTVVVPELPSRGTLVDRFTVTTPVHHGKHATVFQARDGDGPFVALRLGTSGLGSQLVEREAEVLHSLAAHAGRAPRFVRAGEANGGRYIATSWCYGAEIRVVASEHRDERRKLAALHLCARIARAYAALHADGVLHGDIHPRHVLVDSDQSVQLLDFSLAALASAPSPAAQLADRFNSLSAPEQAESLLRAEDVPLTAASEQYSVAALLYLLLTGRMYALLPRTRRDLARAILECSPLKFTEHGLDPWTECEAVVARALHKRPERRYSSMADLAQALEAVSYPAESAHRRRSALTRSVDAPLADLLQAFRREAYSEEAFARLTAPTCSINFGAAGVAFALMRLGKLTGDGAAFEHAEGWLSFAERSRAATEAFDDGDELTPETIGLVSPYHSASGLDVVRALLSEATGDQARQQAALDAFRSATQAPCANLDLTLGRSSVLLSAALLYAGAERDWPAAQRLASYGDELCAGIWRDLPETAIIYHGIAHGWAGIVHASLMWAHARGGEPPPAAREILEMLASIAEPCERGARWPVAPGYTPGSDQYGPGWCHGNAGYVFLWDLAYTTYGEGLFAELAERAAQLAQYPAGLASLCCGAAGQFYALLNHHRSTGDDVWRSRAIRLANCAAEPELLAEDARTPLGLYKGRVGVALLAAELESPERAAMPLFEFERRPAAKRRVVRSQS
jgi:serine/threonine-protein kinase